MKNNKLVNLVNAENSFSLGGLSNTPPNSYFSLTNSSCIDYLKVRFDEPFCSTEDIFKEFLTLLRVIPSEYTEGFGRIGYVHSVVYGENIYVLWGGETTKLIDGTETTIIELTGSACREFEENGGDWLKLFQYILEKNLVVKRIDIALDDYENHVSQETLLRKVRAEEFTSRFRSKPVITISNGLTITFGKQSSNFQLCIYDKKAERNSKGYELLCDLKSWTRYESRFMGDGTKEVVTQVYQALLEHSETCNLSLLSKVLLNGLFKLVVDGSVHDVNINHCKTYQAWLDLIGSENNLVPKIEYLTETTICEKTIWFARSVIPSLVQIYLADSENFDNLIGYLICCFVNDKKLTHKKVAAVNRSRDRFGYKRFTDTEATVLLKNKFGKFEIPSEKTKIEAGKFTFNDDGEIEYYIPTRRSKERK
jgi:Putative phage replication protein RstA